MTDTPEPLPSLSPIGFMGIVHGLDKPPPIPDMFLDDADEGDIGKTADAPDWLVDAMAQLTNPNP